MIRNTAKQFFKDEERVFLVKLAILALSIRFLFSIAYYHFFIEALKTPLYAFDGEAYSILGWYIALVFKGVNMSMVPSAFIPNDYSLIGGLLGTIVNFSGHLPPISKYGVGFYSYLIGGFYYIFGYAPICLRFLMGIVSVFTAFLAYLVARRIFSEKAGRITYVFCLFMPSFILYSSSPQRDTIVNFFTMLGISCILAIRNLGGAAKIFLIITVLSICLLVLDLLRPNVVMVLLVFLALNLFIWFAFYYKRIALLSISGILFFQPIFVKLAKLAESKIYLMLNFHRGLNYLGGSTFKLLPDEYYAVIEAGKWASPITMPVAIIWTVCIKGITMFLFEPSPLSLNKFSQLSVLPQMLTWYFILLFFFFGVFNCLRSPDINKLSLVAAAALFAFTIGISEANYETMLRHRDMIAPVFIMISAYGMTQIGRLKKT